MSAQYQTLGEAVQEGMNETDAISSALDVASEWEMRAEELEADESGS